MGEQGHKNNFQRSTHRVKPRNVPLKMVGAEKSIELLFVGKFFVEIFRWQKVGARRWWWENSSKRISKWRGLVTKVGDKLR